MSNSTLQRVATTVAVGVLLSLALVTPTLASTTWRWSVSGTLDNHAVCTKSNTAYVHDVCAYKVANAPSKTGTVTGVVRVSNSGAKVTCYGLSLSTTYMAGLHSFCVKPHSTGLYRTSGPARHYDGTQITIFVTSGSKTRPIAPMASAVASPFTITFTQP